MSRLIASILLAILLFPLASVVYIVVFFVYMQATGWSGSAGEGSGFIAAGVTTWVFVAAYWVLLWRKSVRWTPQRKAFTSVAAVCAGVVAAVAGSILAPASGSFGAFVGTVLAPLLWLVATVFLWRETAVERAKRLSASGQEAVVCVACGYNLTGLKGTRCPECGREYTLDELFASQPGKVTSELGG